MSIFDIFKQAPAQQPTPAPAAAQPGAPVQPPATTIPAPNVEPAQGPNTAPNGVVPADPNNPASADPSAANADKSPLADWAQLWETKPIDPDAAAPTDPLAIDADALQKQVGKISFTDSVTPELLAKVTAGGEEASAALVEVINLANQNALAQATLVANKLAQRATNHEAQAIDAKVTEIIKANLMTQNLQETNPLFNHPAVQPVMDSVKSQLSIKYPDATPAELAGKAQAFVVAMANSLNPQAASAANPTAPDASEDWGKFLDLPQQ